MVERPIISRVDTHNEDTNLSRIFAERNVKRSFVARMARRFDIRVEIFELHGRGFVSRKEMKGRNVFRAEVENAEAAEEQIYNHLNTAV